MFQKVQNEIRLTNGKDEKHTVKRKINLNEILVDVVHVIFPNPQFDASIYRILVFSIHLFEAKEVKLITGHYFVRIQDLN